MIIIQGLSKQFIDHVAVTPFDLHVASGQIVALLGPLGSGNSVVMRMLATLVEPSGGQASLAGCDLRTQPAAVREVIGYLPDLPGSYDDMRVEEYLTFFAAAAHLGSAARRRTERLVREAGLDGVVDHYCGTLDREARQRLGIVKCLLPEPPVLLLDKPGGGLDLAARGRLLELITRLVHGQPEPPAVLIATNLLSDAARIASQAAIFSAGSLLCTAPMAQVGAWLAPWRIIELELGGDPAPSNAASLLKRLQGDAGVVRADQHERFVIFSLREMDADPLAYIDQLAREGFPIAAFREHEVDPLAAPELMARAQAATPAQSGSMAGTLPASTGP